MKPSRTHALAALAVAALAFAVYLRTMYPGLVMFGDSPKFQFVGRIWGTPHNPGYPLYIVISHLFGLLPIGTLAYRINLMSAVFGAISAGLLVLLVARLARSAWAGVAAGLGLAFGRVFWSQALVAEVYTLATALLIATTFFAVKWTEGRRERDLLFAILFAAIAVGNHLTIVMFAPGLVALVLLTDWRAAIRPRVLLIGTALIVAGLAQYLLLIYLTRRGAPYLESAPHNFSELIPVVAGAEFQNRFGHFGWRDLFTSRSARLLGILLDETTIWGAVAAATGLIVLLRRRLATAAGLLLGGVGVWAFILDYDVADPQVFLVPVFVVLWIFAGVAAGAAVDLASRAGRIPAAIAGVTAALVAGLVLYGGNRRANDHHGRNYETDLMNAIFLTLPTRAIVAWSAFSEQLLLQYKLYGEHAGADRAITEHGVDVERLKEAFAREQPVYALSQARDRLARSGFVFEPVALRLEPQTEPVLFRLVGVRECRDIAHQGWIDAGPLTGGGRIAARVDNYRPFESDFWLVLGHDTPIEARLLSAASPNAPSFTRRSARRSDAAALHTILSEAAFPAETLPQAEFIDVIHVRVNDNGDFALLTFDLGAPPRFALMRGTTDLKSNPKRLTVCAGDTI